VRQSCRFCPLAWPAGRNIAIIHRFTWGVDNDKLLNRMTAKKLLVADDSLTIQRVIKMMLQSLGYEIMIVSNGREAVEQISLFRPDAVLIDVSLPEMDAFAVKRWANSHEDTRHIRFILISSEYEPVDEATAEELRFDGRLKKPFAPDLLRALISKVTQSGSSSGALAELASQVPADLDDVEVLTPPPSGMKAQPRNLPPRPPVVTPPPPTRAPAAPQKAQPPAPPRAPVAPFEAPSSSARPAAPLPPVFSPSEPPSFTDDLPSLDGPSVPPPWDSPAPAFTPEPARQEEVTRGGDTDIRRLTESTIRMSGLEEFDWSVSESARKESELPSFDPSPLSETTRNSEPTSIFMDAPETSDPANDYRIDFPPAPPFAASRQEYAPLPPFASEPAPFAPQPPQPGSPAFAYHSAPDTAPPFSFDAPSAPEPTYTSAQVESMVQKQVEEALLRMSHTLLPELAEKIIRQEIRRMLSDQPGA
jgi:CheY-like chemotaxis protein